MGSVAPVSVQKLVAREIRRCVSEAVIRDVKAGVAVELGRPRPEELPAPTPVATLQSPSSPVGR
jgi:hypothetical protein